MSDWQDSIEPNSTRSAIFVLQTAQKVNAPESVRFQSPQLLSVLDLWILDSNSPVFLLRGQDTLTIGDQLRWKQAKIMGQLLQHPTLITDVKSESTLVFSPLADLPRIYLRNGNDVRAFLASHPRVEPFLSISWPFLIKHFGPQVQVTLELMQYPGEQVEPELVAWIQCSDPVLTGLAELDAFQEEWFLDQIDDINARFNFNLEFV